MPSDSPRDSSKFADAKYLGEIPTGSPPVGAPNKGRVSLNGRFSTIISLYHRNGARYGHSYYRRLIGTHSLCRMALFSVTPN